MQFPDTFFEDEVREGFYVPAMMKCAWAAQLEVLQTIDEICRRHQIHWFADNGTLLGAVRHGGFIPWDDDLDICMLQEDYERFNEIAPNELPKRYVLKNVRRLKDHYSLITRVINKDKFYADEEEMAHFHRFPYIAGVDIFPMHYLFSDPQQENERKSLCKIIAATANAVEANGPNQESVKANLLYIERKCRVHMERNTNLLWQLYCLLDKLFSAAPAHQAKEVAYMNYWITHDDHRYPVEYFRSPTLLPFENTKLSAPAAFNEVLQIEYGNYIQPHSDGGAHDYPYYDKYYRQLKEEMALEWPPKYHFSESDLKKGAAKGQKSVRLQVKEFIEFLENLQQQIERAVQSGAPETILERLEEGQNTVIETGNRIEEECRETGAVISLLETYCEQLYFLHTAITDGVQAEIAEGCEALRTLLFQIDKAVKQSVTTRKEILFLPCRAKYWNAMASVWRAAAADPSCDATVVPLPYYDKDAYGRFGAFHYDRDEYPGDVPTTDYRLYHFNLHRPDIIVIQNPYDQYHYTMSVPEFFYAGNLKNYTDKLVYIPYFVIDEAASSDERALANAENYVNVPGVVQADQVIVQSENIRQMYINVLVQFAGAATRPIWEAKISGFGSPKTDIPKTKKEDLDIPEEWKSVIVKPDGGKKKILLYGISAAALLSSEEQMLLKIEDSLRLFQENAEEIALIWKPEPIITTILPKLKPELWKSYEVLVSAYQKAGWGIFDVSENSLQAVELCDAYYGDMGILMAQCRTRNIPVMVQNIGCLNTR